MNMSLRLHLVIVLLLFPSILLAKSSAGIQASSTAPSASKPYPTMSGAAITRARQLSTDFENGNSATLWAALSPEMKKQYGSAVRLTGAAKEVMAKLGPVKKVTVESTAPNLLHPGTDYACLTEFTKSTVKVLTILGLNEQGEATLFLFRPVPDISEGSTAGYKDVTKFKLPFSDTWFVYQGGRSLVQSAHFGGDEERYAMDFVPLKNWLPFSGDGSTNEQFYCFGQPVLAPADGTVIRLQDGFADNEPGKPARDAGLGNQVILSHGNNEFSALGHLKQNSIKVKKGDKVKQGDTIAACGNSGNSPAPHLEYRLQNSHGYPSPKTLPIQFVDYTADGKLVESGEPVRGQLVSNGGTAATAATK
jgi:hypothetical protein